MVSACSDSSALSCSDRREEKPTETPCALKQGGPTTRVRPWWLEGKSLLILATSSMNKKMFIYANQVHCNVCCREKKKIIILKKKKKRSKCPCAEPRVRVQSTGSSSWRVFGPAVTPGAGLAAAAPPRPAPGRRHFPQLRERAGPGPAPR